jgi:hypothetical protein
VQTYIKTVQVTAQDTAVIHKVDSWVSSVVPYSASRKRPVPVPKFPIHNLRLGDLELNQELNLEAAYNMELANTDLDIQVLLACYSTYIFNCRFT